MNLHELSLNEEINIYLQSGLTPTELFIARLLFLAIDGDPQPLKRYLNGVTNGKLVFKNVLLSLKEKKVILSSFVIPEEGETLNFKNIPLNKKFLKNYLRESNDLGKEFFDAYPPFININGKLVSIRNFTKAGLFSFEDFCLFYAKAIKNSGVTHERILELLEFAKDNNLIHYSIIEFLASRKYQEIQYIKDSGDINGYSNSEFI